VLLFLIEERKHRARLSGTARVGLAEEDDLELIVTRQDTSTSDGTEDVGTSTLEEGLVTLLVDDLLEGIERGRVLDGLTRGHHHSSADGINGVGGETSQVGDTESENEGGEERSLELSGQQGLDGIVKTEVQTTVNDNTESRERETAVKTGNTIGGDGLAVDINETVELTGTTVLALGIVGKTGTGVIQGVDEEEGAGTSGTTGGNVTGEPLGVTVTLLLEVEHGLEVILESEVQSLGGEVTDDVGGVTSPEGLDTLISNDTLEAVSDALVGVGETAGLEHLILVLEEKLDTLNGGSSGLGDGGGNTSHEEIGGESLGVLLRLGLGSRHDL